MKPKWGLTLITAVVIIIADGVTKSWCMTHLPLNQPRPWIGHLVYLTLLYNNRGAFSLFPLPNALFIAIVFAMLIGIAIYAIRTNLSIFYQVIVGLILGGGFGNLLDRLRYGYVVDFIDLRWWPVFNVADSAVSVAVTAIVVMAFWKQLVNRDTPG